MSSMVDASGAPIDEDDASSSDGEPEIGLEGLRPEALAALLEVRSAREDAVALEAEATDGAVAEDFGLSQFWYSDACSDALAKACAAGARGGRVAVVSCPSVHRALCRAGDERSVLFEFDERCGAHLPAGRFAKYDFNADFRATIPAAFESQFDFVILDPPYVSRDAVGAFWAFATWLARDAAAPPRALFLTSVVNRDWLLETPAFGGLRLTAFDLEFTSKLATPLRAFTNSGEFAEEAGGFAADDD
jgi:hypothetical protein